MRRPAPQPARAVPLERLSDEELQARCGPARWERLVGWVLPWPAFVGAIVLLDAASHVYGRLGVCVATGLVCALAVAAVVGFGALGERVPARAELKRRFGAAPVEHYVRQALALPAGERPAWTALLQWRALPRGGTFLVSVALHALTKPWSSVELRGLQGNVSELTRVRLLREARPLTESEWADLLTLLEARAGHRAPPEVAVVDGAPCVLAVVEASGAVHTLRFNLAGLGEHPTPEPTQAFVQRLLALETSLRPRSSLPPGVGVVER